MLCDTCDSLVTTVVTTQVIDLDRVESSCDKCDNITKDSIRMREWKILQNRKIRNVFLYVVCSFVKPVTFVTSVFKLLKMHVVARLQHVVTSCHFVTVKACGFATPTPFHRVTARASKLSRRFPFAQIAQEFFLHHPHRVRRINFLHLKKLSFLPYAETMRKKISSIVSSITLFGDNSGFTHISIGKHPPVRPHASLSDSRGVNALHCFAGKAPVFPVHGVAMAFMRPPSKRRAHVQRFPKAGVRPMAWASFPPDYGQIRGRASGESQISGGLSHRRLGVFSLRGVLNEN